MSRGEVADTVDARWEQLRSSGLGVRRSTVRESLYVPEAKSVVERFFTDTDGSIWVKLERDDVLCWWVFGRDGEPRGSVALPKDGIRKWGMSATPTHVWFVHRDQLDRDALFRYEIRFAGERPEAC